MDKTPKAIETEYNGYRFRSKLEARWAVFFDAMNMRYEYEPEGFELADGTRYLPDFYLPDLRMYAEVKAPREGAIEELIKPLSCVEDQTINRIVFLSNIPYDERSKGWLWWYPVAYYDNLSMHIEFARVGIDIGNDGEGFFIDHFYMCHWEQPCAWCGSVRDKRFIDAAKRGDLLSPINDLDMPYKTNNRDDFRFCETVDYVDYAPIMNAYKKARSARFGQKRRVA